LGSEEVALSLPALWRVFEKIFGGCACATLEAKKKAKAKAAAATTTTTPVAAAATIVAMSS